MNKIIYPLVDKNLMHTVAIGDSEFVSNLIIRIAKKLEVEFRDRIKKSFKDILYKYDLPLNECKVYMNNNTIKLTYADEILAMYTLPSVTVQESNLEMTWSKIDL